MNTRRGLCAIAITALAVAGSSRESIAQKCLDAPFTASDTAQIAAVRAIVDTFCDCDTFDGVPPARTHGKYVKCAGDVVVDKFKANKLRAQCKGLVKKIYAKSRCGFASTPNGDKLPCVKKMVSDGKVTCAVKPSGACNTNPGVFTQVACSDTYTCLDAGDTNANLILDPADAGTCAAVLGPIVGTSRDIPSGAEPANTPNGTTVPITNLAMQEQFGSTLVSLNRATFSRYRYARRSGTPDAILILVPGFAGGANNFHVLAQNLIERTRVDEGLLIEVWAFDRRGNQLEDMVGLNIAERREDPMAAIDFLFGAEVGFPQLSLVLRSGPGAPNRRAFFYNSSNETAFMANWTNLVFSRDIDAVVELARALAENDNVFLGGHSAGTGFTARYASTDFNLTGVGPTEPGYGKLRGLVLFDGSGGSTAGAGAITADTLDRIEAKANGGLHGAILASGGRCADGTTACTIATEAADCIAEAPPKCTTPVSTYTTGLGILALSPRLLATADLAGVQAMNDLEGGQALTQVDLFGNGSAVDTVPELGILTILPDANVAASVGNFFDDDGLAVAAGASFVATSLGAPGPTVMGLATWFDYDDSGSFPPAVIPDNGPPPTSLPAGVWGQEVESTRMTRLTGALAYGRTNFTDWYYPTAGPSTTSVSGVCSGTSGTCTVGNVGAACSGGTQAQANAQCNQALNLDTTALSIGRGRRDIENLTQAANIDIPVICFGGSNGLTPVPGNYVPFGTSIGTCTAPSCDGTTARVVDALLPNPAFPTLGDVAGGFEVHISEGLAHLDVINAEDDASNDVIAPLAAFLGRNTIP